MLAKRIIPTFLKRGGSLVKGKQFNSWRSVGHVLQAVRIYQARGVDELLFIDIETETPDFKSVETLAEECYMPLTYGGGVKDIMDVKRLLEVGADKVLIGSAAFNPHLISDCYRSFGKQAIVVSIDVAKDGVRVNNGKDPIAPFTTDVVSVAKDIEKRGAGEILLQSIEREGTMEGYDINMIKTVSEAVNIPVVASGGCKDYEDMAKAIKAGASAVAVGSLFLFTDSTPKEASQYLKGKGIEVR